MDYQEAFKLLNKQIVDWRNLFLEGSETYNALDFLDFYAYQLEKEIRKGETKNGK